MVVLVFLYPKIGEHGQEKAFPGLGLFSEDTFFAFQFRSIFFINDKFGRGKLDFYQVDAIVRPVEQQVNLCALFAAPALAAPDGVLRVNARNAQPFFDLLDVLQAGFSTCLSRRPRRRPLNFR